MMIKRKLDGPARDYNSNDASSISNESPPTKSKRQKLNSSSTGIKKQPANRKQGYNQQQVSASAENQRQNGEPVWIYGLINNIEQMMSQFNAANNNQKLQQVVQRQQQQQNLANGSASKSSSKPGRAGSKSSRPSNNSSGYSTPSSLYSSASLSPPFSNSSPATSSVYTSSSSSNSPISAPKIQSPKQQQTNQAKQQHSVSAKTQASMCKTNQQQQLPRSPLSRQIKFHEYKGPPQTRRPSNQQKQQQSVAPEISQFRAGAELEANELSDNSAAPQIRKDFVSDSSFQLQQQQQQLVLPMQSNVFDSNNSQAQGMIGVQERSMGPSTLSNGQLGQAQSVELIDRRRQVMILNQQRHYPHDVNAGRFEQPSLAFAANIANQQPRPSQLTLQLIRRPDGQQQQVLVVDPVAFQQMQQRQQQQQFDCHFTEHKQNIIVFQQEPMIANQAINGYNALLSNNNNNQSDDNNFQINQMSNPTVNAFSTNPSSESLIVDNQINRNYLDQDVRCLKEPAKELYYRSSQQAPLVRTVDVQLQQTRHQPFAVCQQGPVSEGTSLPSSIMTADDYIIQENHIGIQTGQEEHLHETSQIISNTAMHYQQSQEMFGGGPIVDSLGRVEVGADNLEDDTCEIEPTISFEGELDHRMMYSEFIDSQDIPLNVDESDWLKKFLPPCSSS